MVAAFNRFQRNRARVHEKRLAKRRERDLVTHVAGRRMRAGERKKQLLKLMLRAGIAGFILMVIMVGSAFAYFAKDLPTAEGIRNRAVAESTKIYARDGKTILFEIFGEERRTSIPFDQIPETVKKATVAIEDDDFYHHHGVDIRGILRAVYKNITGGQVQGGSTITQQLVKNAILTSERTFTRKIKEVILAIEIEQKFSKDEILSLYLNEIPYGSNAYGIESAAQTYFNKDAKDLNLAESALLASLPQSPTYLSPFGPNKEELLSRKDTVLDRMSEQELISEEEAEKAKAEELKFTKQKIEIKAPHFVFWVKEQLVEEFGENLVERGGLKVTTTLDMGAQEIAEKAVKAGADRNAAQYGAKNAALTAVDPKTGQVIAHVGSRDYFDEGVDGSVDVTRTPQQPGSSFKPYSYAAAFAKGYPPSTILFDVATDFGGGYKPKNYSGGFSGPVSMRSALGQSLNIPAVKTTYLAGLDTTIDLAKKMGITDLNDRDQYGLAVGLGAAEIKLVDHVAAFGVFANEGRKIERTTILKVEDPSGRIIDEWKQPDGEQVLDKNVALTMSDVLADDGARAPVFGSGSALTLPDRRVAAKSGTTNDNRDALTMGYTPQIVTGVWVGNNDNTPFPGGDGAYTAAPIWHEFMINYHKGKDATWYEAPQAMAANKPVLSGVAGAKGEKVRISKIDGKRAPGDLPEACVEEKEFVEYHDILFYLSKDDPLGAAPSNPAADPMFNNWEGAVRAYAGKKNDGKAPEETSPMGAAQITPSISITQPAAGSVVASSPITISASVSAPAGVTVVDFAVDGALVGSSAAEPFAITVPISTSNGFHTVTAVVTERCGLKAETSVDFQVQVDTSAPTAAITVNKTAVNVDVSGAGSTDNVGIVSYSWDFGDGATASGVTASHVYAPGTYTIKLSVLDAAGLGSTATATITVP
jgi:1A family penicillin-binding protein